MLSPADHDTAPLSAISRRIASLLVAGFGVAGGVCDRCGFRLDLPALCGHRRALGLLRPKLALPAVVLRTRFPLALKCPMLPELEAPAHPLSLKEASCRKLSSRRPVPHAAEASRP
jgi:hypothetical protein